MCIFMQNGTWDDCPCQCDTSPCCRSCTKGINGKIVAYIIQQYISALYTHLLVIISNITAVFHALGSCEIGGQVFGHNEEFIHPNDSCKNCTCKVNIEGRR